jgi:hypothetical protein
MAVEPQLSDQELASLMEIPHPSKANGESLYGATKVFPDYQAEAGETYFGLVHGLVHESSVSFVAVLQAIRAEKKGFETLPPAGGLARTRRRRGRPGSAHPDPRHPARGPRAEGRRHARRRPARRVRRLRRLLGPVR